MLSAHNVNFEETMKGLNFYQKIKVVNMCDDRFVYYAVSAVIYVVIMRSIYRNTWKASNILAAALKSSGINRNIFPTYDDDSLLCVLDDTPNDETEDSVVRIISEDTIAQINKDAERLSLENFPYA
ncbi:unnamed protein product [Ceratitis capitata]|uniref:(Mediterranean fruit fly) hypothetical protein n=1 Tax=Ceratitis capitata TaxID=7213 RepID=A0A811V7T7_CERCA|nr:unnamed protein product [Ceratitis capitata]